MSVCNRWAEFLLKLLDTFESGMKWDSDSKYYWRIYAKHSTLVCCVSPGHMINVWITKWFVSVIILVFNYINVCVLLGLHIQAGRKLIQILSTVKLIWRNVCTGALAVGANLLYVMAILTSTTVLEICIGIITRNKNSTSSSISCHFLISLCVLQ